MEVIPRSSSERSIVESSLAGWILENGYAITRITKFARKRDNAKEPTSDSQVSTLTVVLLLRVGYFLGRRAAKKGIVWKRLPRNGDRSWELLAVGEFSEMLFALLIAHSSFHHGGAPPILPLSPFVFFYAIWESCRKIDDGERHR